MKTAKKILSFGYILAICAAVMLPPLLSITDVRAASVADDAGSTNISDPGFKFIVCDGPAKLNELHPDPNFRPCDFNGLMRQAQHLIDVMVVLGVLGAIVGFSYAGYLHITGVPSKIEQSYDIFKKVGIGFIIMISAWFIVFQILSWLTGNSAFKALLGNPS